MPEIIFPISDTYLNQTSNFARSKTCQCSQTTDKPERKRERKKEKGMKKKKKKQSLVTIQF